MSVIEPELNTPTDDLQATSERAEQISRIGHLAESHVVVSSSPGKKLLLFSQPRQYSARLREAYQHFAQIAKEEFAVSYAGEWLLDNFYIVEQAQRQVLEDIPDQFYDELPKLVGSDSGGLPRVHAIAHEITRWNDNPFTLEQIEDFIQLYQDVTPLTMGELWALPAMLRVANLENLTWAVCHLAGIQDLSPDFKPVTLPTRNSDEMIVANSIINLRMLATQDWKAYFEAVSRVEQKLQQDPARIYSQMDFVTRNRYRQIIEELAPEDGAQQEAVAHTVVAFAQKATTAPNNLRAGHIGYYLIDAGRQQLEREIGYQAPWTTKLWRTAKQYAGVVYLASIAFVTAILLLAVGGYVTNVGENFPQIVLALGVSFLPTTAAAVNLVNWIISLTTPPSVLPKMDFSKAIPPEFRTMVVIPALLSDNEEVNSLSNQLEQHYLRNNDPNLTFALLLDYMDAPEQKMPQDEKLLDHARSCVHYLNNQYGTSERQPFYLFLRERQWNASENVWMGRERKRGKLAEFNQLILNPGTATSYIVRDGDLSILPSIRYVITLDADTVLPANSAHWLVGTLAHPLNQAKFDDTTNRIIFGYTILQPRVEIMPTAANRTWFTRIFAGDTGLDLYTLAVSDVYQDWFGEGIYTGKGIYDVAAFERSLAGRTPENRLLSHDLFEGLHGRTGLVTDVVLLEDYPPHYLVHMRRLHRWIRGDWQLLPWLQPNVPVEGERKGVNPFTPLDRWKILDNLRRSLYAPTLVLLFAAGWLWLPGSALIWTLFALLMSAVPFLTSLINQARQLLQGSPGEVIQQQLGINALRWFLSLTFLPHETVIALHAIITTLFNLARRKHLLRWTSAANVRRLLGDNLTRTETWQEMLPGLALVTILGALVALTHPVALPVALPVLVIWIIAPEFVYQLSRPSIKPSPGLSDEQHQQLRSLARRTWLFFERFVGPEDNWLPPDHYQEAPLGIVVHSTSPTNIGLFLLSAMAAYDLGYMGILELSTRLQSTFETLEKLERYRGHFLNWYDTRTLHPLTPGYVSTVDSGNLACSLLTLQQGLKDLLTAPIIRPQRWQGVIDTLILIEETLAKFDAMPIPTDIATLRRHLENMREQIETVQNDPSARTSFLETLLHETWPTFTQRLIEVIDTEPERFAVSQLTMLRMYVERVEHHFQNMARDVKIMLPWLGLLVSPPALFSTTSASNLQTAREALMNGLPLAPNFNDLSNIYQTGKYLVRQLENHLASEPEPPELIQEARQWCSDLDKALKAANLIGEDLRATFDGLIRQIDTYLVTMDFKFLFDNERKVFHIGYNVTTERLDNSYYDLLTSEARTASLFAIAMAEISQEHWLHMGRPQTHVQGARALLSWSGTMFEYLMPILMMRTYPGTLLDQTYEAAINTQIAYAARKHVPWGISESGYYAFDSNQNYQYRAFGVPDLAFKRGQAADLVITPYASLLALPIKPQAVMQNITELERQKALGVYGFYEAIDFTASRLALGQQQSVVREYMAHHQAMILLTLVNYLHDDLMVRRFHADPRIQSVELLLQEQIPKQAMLQYPALDEANIVRTEQSHINTSPWPVQATAPLPQVHFLSNGQYSVMVTSAGGGYSQWQATALTRWRADTTQEDWGTWIYVRDQESGALWSAAHLPVGAPANYQNVLFYPHKVEFQRQDYDITMQMEITVPPNDNVEVRRIRLTNQGDTTRRLLIASYGEVILAPQENDLRHPAFNKLFIESEFIPQVHGLLFRRRGRASSEKPIYMIHSLVTESGQARDATCETDRARFLGRHHTFRKPANLTQPQVNLSGTSGATLDPIMTLAQEIEIAPRASIQLAYVTLAAETRAQALALARTYQVWSTLDRAFDQARYQSELEMRQLDLHSPDVARIQKMLSALLYPQASLRADTTTLALNTKGQSGLWAYGISGDYPIVLLRIGDERELSLAHELIKAHTYWRNRQLKVTLVILNQRDTGYTQELYNQVHRLIVRMGSELWINRHDGIFLLRADLLSENERTLLSASARVYLDGGISLTEQLEVLSRQPVYLPTFTPSFVEESTEPTPTLSRPEMLAFDNGLGGFSPDGREYIMYLASGQKTPAPWINVIANPEFGFITSESGGGFTWSGNSSENRLTAWRNDPVTDMPSEAIYLRDEESAQIWSPAPMPAGDAEPYLIRHGWGYSTFEHHSQGLKQSITLYTAQDAPVKIVRLRLENTWSSNRRITATYYVEWVIGTMREVTQQYIIPEFDADEQILLFRNPYSIEFGHAYAFLTASKGFHGLTTDRTEFIGRLGSLEQPAALTRIGLSGNIRAGQDPCAAVQLHIDLASGASEEICFVLGAANDRDTAIDLARQYRDLAQVEMAWKATTAFWENLLTSIMVQTPDLAMNTLLPWTLYQALSCRIWGRSGLYQSSGAFGFRDQLQDVMALIHVRPDITREHILRAARHQFEAGDVLHWWHPPSNRGVRTRFSDDLIWLPYVVANYIAATADHNILQDKIPFLRGELLKQDEDERYGLYEPTTESYSLYEHCLRALNKGYTVGAHGLPLMGSGDWNDGMNRVGIEGRGESVWVGWFLYATMSQFVPLCQYMGDDAQAATYRQRMSAIQSALEHNAWDGEWYLRAFYDDGTPLGSAQNLECQIDSIAQSWGVLSKGADPKRARQAMESVMKRLVNQDDQLLMLFTPPFDETNRDPGYIKGYPPGIRENGGQYTHAAIWTAWAVAELGLGDEAAKLYRLLNPIYHSDTFENAARYRVEPYVIAADIYSVPPHVGRGGWTWYTGSSGWMYRLGIEAILGLRREGNFLLINPCIPKDWPQYELTYCYGKATYHIRVENPAGVNQGVKQVMVNDQPANDLRIPLSTNQRDYKIIVYMG